MGTPAPTSHDLLVRMLAKVDEMRRALDAAGAAGADVDGAQARAALDDLERRIRAALDDAV